MRSDRVAPSGGVSLVRSLRRKFQRSLSAHGLLGTVRLCLMQPYLWLRFGKTERRRTQTQQEFDRRFGVDTAGIIYLSDLRIDSPNFAYGTRYSATLQKTFNGIIGSLGLPLEQFTFIDLGSGKGAVLLFASEFPFKRIIGAEFSQELHEVAVRNIGIYKSDSQKCRQIQSVCADATQYEFPLEPLLIYLNTPFGKEVCSLVLANIARSLNQASRPVYILYNNFGYDQAASQLFDDAPFLQEVLAGADRKVFRAIPH